MTSTPLPEHKYHRIAALRAAVLGANDGILSVSSLVLGVASSNLSARGVVVVGIAGLLSGTLAMSAGEYVSVRSQADAESAELDVERAHLRSDIDAEHEELAAIYRSRGLTRDLAGEVARQLMAHDALGAHARDELGLSDTLRARPVRAALASGSSFALGGALPLAMASVAHGTQIVLLTAATSVGCLGLLGGLAAWAGGASVPVGAWRVAVWGAASMLASCAVGHYLGTQVMT